MTCDNPFEALGLPARADLTDDEVRAAWRRIAAATHPDRADGGDTDRFATAAAAYATLRIPYGRTEAHADLTAPTPPQKPHSPHKPSLSCESHSPREPSSPHKPHPPREPSPSCEPHSSREPSPFGWRVRAGRPGIAALRLMIAIAVSGSSIAVAGWQPATFAILTGTLTWLARTIRHDLAPASG